MALGTRSYASSFSNRGGLPQGIKGLLIANTAVFLVQYFGGRALGELFTYFALYPDAVVKFFMIWQLFTYLFLHGGVMHLLWNMLALWMFGTELERLWGTNRFLRFYFICGVGAGLCVVIANYLFGNPSQGTIGASGAIYGLLAANAVLWPDRVILFNFLIPIKMKYYVMIIGGIAFLGARNINSGVSEVAHLTGMAFGYLQLRMPGLAKADPIGVANHWYRQWRIQRAKRKFQVYMKKHNSDRGPWTN
jgi:membrane associated rhomboid family serine protease